MGRLNPTIHVGSRYKVGRFNDQEWEKRGSATDYIYDVAYLKISAIIKAEIADAVRRLPRIMFERNRRPSIGGFCVNRRSYFLSETMIATRTPKANIKDSAS